MILLPYENIKLETNLSKSQVLTRIAENIAPPNRISNKDFEGQVNKNEFIIRRKLKSGMNSFIPNVYGQVVGSKYGYEVKIKIRLRIGIYLSLTIITLFNFSLLYPSFELSNVLFFLAPYLMTIFFYNIESNSIKRFLKDIVIKK